MSLLTPAQFSLKLREWCDLKKQDVDTVCREVAIKIFSGLIDMSPVGNPELWAANAHAVQWNNDALEANAGLRLNPANLTKAGRLRPGKKVHGRALPAGKGYAGGRFKSAWTVSFSPNVVPPPEGSVDPEGGKTKQRGRVVLKSFGAGGLVHFVNPLPYAIRLEYGWSRQAPAGFARITLMQAQHMISESVARLKAGKDGSDE